jgi:hypothetical protein
MKNLNLESLGLKELTVSHQQKVVGGRICIFCVRGLLDGVKGNTTFNWGCCQKKFQ